MCGNTLFFSSRCKQKILATLYENPREENSPTSRGKNECTMERTIHFDSGIFFRLFENKNFCCILMDTACNYAGISIATH